jgi:hypothetical protein
MAIEVPYDSDIDYFQKKLDFEIGMVESTKKSLAECEEHLRFREEKVERYRAYVNAVTEAKSIYESARKRGF